MKALIVADLHADFWDDDGRDPIAGLEEELSELTLVILAGDVSNKPKVHWPRTFERLSRHVEPRRIFVFPGNHDFYKFRIDGEDRLRGIAESHGVVYANCAEINLCTVRFLCTTLWTDFELFPGRLQNEAHVPTRMNDFRQIRVARDGYRRVWPRDLVALHLSQKAWLEERLATPFAGRTIVVTHHVPHPDALSARDRAEPGLAAAYASDLGDMIERHRPDEWLFGHSHGGTSLEIGRCRLSNVSLGYPHDVPDPQSRLRDLIREF